MDIRYDKDMHEYLIEIDSCDPYGEEPLHSIKVFYGHEDLGSVAKAMRLFANMLKEEVGPNRDIYMGIYKIEPDELSTIRGWRIYECMDERKF